MGSCMDTNYSVDGMNLAFIYTTHANVVDNQVCSAWVVDFPLVVIANWVGFMQVVREYYVDHFNNKLAAGSEYNWVGSDSAWMWDEQFIDTVDCVALVLTTMETVDCEMEIILTIKIVDWILFDANKIQRKRIVL